MSTACDPYGPRAMGEPPVRVSDIIRRLSQDEMHSMVARFAGAAPSAFERGLRDMWQLRAAAGDEDYPADKDYNWGGVNAEIAR